MPHRPPTPPPFPYPTLFRSPSATDADACSAPDTEPAVAATMSVRCRTLSQWSVGACQLVQFTPGARSEEHTSELQSPVHLVCRLLLEKKKKRMGNWALC